MSEPWLLGRYEIVAELGKGAMGVVYRANDPMLNRILAIKTINMEEAGQEGMADYEARFYTEAKAAGSLNHPNIIIVYDIGKSGHLVYMAMEYIEGRELRELLGQFHRDTVGPSTGPILDLAVVEPDTLNDAVTVAGSAVRITMPRIAAATDRSGNHVDHFREIRNTSLIAAACRHDQATTPGCICGVGVEWQCDREPDCLERIDCGRTRIRVPGRRSDLSGIAPRDIHQTIGARIGRGRRQRCRRCTVHGRIPCQWRKRQQVRARRHHSLLLPLQGRTSVIASSQSWHQARGADEDCGQSEQCCTLCRHVFVQVRLKQGHPCDFRSHESSARGNGLATRKPCATIRELTGDF